MRDRVSMRVDVLVVKRSLFLCLWLMVARSAAQCPSATFLPSDVIRGFDENAVTDQLAEQIASLEARVPVLFQAHGVETYAVTVVYGNSTIYSAGLVDTPFLIASVTKAFTAMGALVLRQRGRLALDDPVKKFLPEFSVINPYEEKAHDITLRELMGHLSGLPRLLCGDVVCGPDTNEKEILRSIAQMQLVRPPWTGLPIYSNLGFALLGHVWEKATSPRQSWGEFIRDAILAPLSMRDTGTDGANVTNFAPGQISSTYPSNTSRGWVGPSGSMYSTALDLAKFLKFLLHPDEELLSRAAIREWIKPTTLFPDAASYRAISGFALPWELLPLDNQSTTAITKNGGQGTYRSIIAFHPESQLGVAVLTSLSTNATNPTSNITMEILQGLVPAVNSVHSKLISALYSGTYTCRRSRDPMVSANIPNVTFQVLGGSVNVTAMAPWGALVAKYNFTMLVNGQEIAGALRGSSSLVLKSAAENSFWTYSGPCITITGLSGDLELARPNFPGSVYSSELRFEPGKKVVRRPSIGAECFK